MGAFFWIFGYKVVDGAVQSLPENLDAEVRGTPIRKKSGNVPPPPISSLNAIIARDQDLSNLYFVQSPVFTYAGSQARADAHLQAAAYVTQGDGLKLHTTCANCVLYELAEG